ncbi:AIPR protein [Abditibacterium utsteinense]|uniref:AIPR protein n=1 Tax=Abditibacterium utsteinense TaxID=1960156 RepID=A0A2S8SQF2_9BACT|nr:AIPR family protein [Abditibacterium utsteinense]PQV63027.1 AIPR protein [Abditibacterium utsteinense]
MSTPETSIQISYEQFCEALIDEIKTQCHDENGVADTTRFKREFVQRLLDTLQNGLNEDDFVWMETGAQNGIDAFYFEALAPEDDEDEPENDALVLRIVRFLSPRDWPATGRAVLQETAKIRQFLSDPNSRAQSDSVFLPLLDFWNEGGAQNRLELLFASAHLLPDAELEAVASAEAALATAAPMAARGALSVKADAISLQSLYLRDHIDRSVQVPLTLRVPDVEAGASFVIGAASLPDLYAFLKEYRARRGDLDPLYEKNVRVFLGRTGSINKGISRTLREEPENFGLYNNGLTIVSRSITPQGDGTFLLTDPSVVNGCQTTRTVWDTLSEKLREPPESDAHAREAWQNWRNRLETGRVVVKIVRVAPGEIAEDDERLENITRYTNAQNAVKAKDFIALDRDFRRWKRELAMRGVFLEILRNEGAAQSARQKPKNYSGPRYRAVAKAFELFKVYGAGWMNEPGDAWNKNAAFVPGGAIFKSITAPESGFGGDDFLAALQLQIAAETHKFGKGGKTVPTSRKLTKFLFYRTSVELLRRLLRRLELPFERADCTRALLALQNSANEWRVFSNYAADAIDDYMRQDSDYSVFKEPSYDGDFNAFFKKSALAKTQSAYPQLWSAWNITEISMKNDATFISKIEPVLRAALA